MQTKPTIGQKIKTLVFGKVQVVTVVAVYSFGTMDVETSTGKRFRLTGLSF
jgi:hypothetical protein